MQCDVRLADDESPWLDGTKCILLLGEYSLHKYIPESREKTLNELRGSLFYIDGIPAIASYFAQDAADIRAYERENNVLSKDFIENEEYYDDDDDEAAEDLKSYGATKRANYAFWLRADVNKVKTILKSGIPAAEAEPQYKTYPNSDEVINALQSTKDSFLYFDMETDIEEANLQCFSFSFDGKVVYNVPVLNNDYLPAYSSLPFIMRALAISIKHNVIVAHNGANFDFFVLGAKYRIPVYRCYDTMIAHHRCWPDVEKSLGHAVSHLTWQKFHKDENSQNYLTHEQMMARMKYCGKDVFTMYLIHKALDKYAKTIPGLTDSIACANAAIVPYLITTLQGIKYHQDRVDDIVRENDRLMEQYLRMIGILIGESGMIDVRRAVKGKARAFANSNPQCIKYFHDLLGYATEGRTPTGNPSLGKKAMFKLALKHDDNPVIPLVLAYRILAKESGALKFLPWKDDNNNIIDWRKYEEDKNIARQNNQLQIQNTGGLNIPTHGASQAAKSSE